MKYSIEEVKDENPNGRNYTILIVERRQRESVLKHLMDIGIPPEAEWGSGRGMEDKCIFAYTLKPNLEEELNLVMKEFE